ncbi:DUF5655 domain-containing protein [Ornithobacterium rhinotracheale]|uniref:DUF5655 domain-containing protein n=1 Tax=Ornithobacterium rhinotracheale TaxID=28251 RepID=UPI00129C4BFE|nr:DUF5655 domain-containing protein [Ornithobacterium rhinotracheale]MCK0204415.1 DUF5655 domain-containing protein [Ornithobacterium rhinotracheale]MRI63512.1 hypothetical protein [Ornithobacterium rhinotracheale]MRJ11338.1 hypothetical protein [Ornithobacterium rhinotracheale]
MALYKIESGDNLFSVKEDEFKLEKEIQQLTEKNLSTIFGLKFVKSEFSLNNFRIDTLAYDVESKSFVIIEYKRGSNFSVIDQGYAYLSLMLNNKSDFILEFNERMDETLKRNDVDWSQSRVIFVSPNFTTYQKEAINFKDLPIELWEVKKYSNKTVSYNLVKTSNAVESVKTITKQDDTLEKVTKEIKVYTEKEHLEKANETIQELYEKLKSAILNLGDIEIKPKKLYVAFVYNTNVVDMAFYKNKLKLWVNLPSGSLDDPRNLCRNVSNIGHWGNGDYELEMENDEDLEYILSLIKQSLKQKQK